LCLCLQFYTDLSIYSYRILKMNIAIRFRMLTVWNNLSVIGSICSIVGLVFFFVMPDKELREIERIKKSDDIKQILGKWNDLKAWEMTGSLLSEQNIQICPFGPSDYCLDKQQKVGIYNLVYSDKKTNKVLVYKTLNDDHCHACSSTISLFEFEKLEKGWGLIASDVDAFEWGIWGGIDNSKLEVKVLGPNIYGILYNLGWTMGSSSGVATAIFAKIADKYTKIFHYQTEGYYTDYREKNGEFIETETTNWIADIKTYSCVLGLCDIRLEVKGKYRSATISDDIRFHFNGNDYVASGLPSYLTN